MKELRAKDAAVFLTDKAGLSNYKASLMMGAKQQYLDAIKRRGGTLRLDTAARLAEVCGCDLLIADHESGEVLARIVARDEHAEQEQTDD